MDVLDLLVILDRSGSMERARADHEGGLRSFIRDQRDLDGDVRLTLVQFDTNDPCEVVIDRKPIGDIREEQIHLIPRGGTPLLDAVGGAVAHLRHYQPSKVITLIITDGEENSSREWTKDRIKALVAECEKQEWAFIFLGADIDAFVEAGAMGIGSATSASFMNAVPDSVASAYSATAGNVLRSRQALQKGQSMGVASMSLMYSDAQRADFMAPKGPHGSVSGGGNSQSNEKAEG